MKINIQRSQDRTKSAHMHEELQKYLDQFSFLSTEEKHQILAKFIYREIPNQFRVVDYGDICKEFFFLIKGSVRLYYLKDGVEITGYLFTEGMFFNSLESFISAQPSIQVIESCEPCQLLVLSKTKLDELYIECPKVNVLIRMLLQERFISAQRMVASFVLDNPEERYLHLLKNNPKLLERFPQHILASYLGITAVSLSRIRKRLSDKTKLS